MNKKISVADFLKGNAMIAIPQKAVAGILQERNYFYLVELGIGEDTVSLCIVFLLLCRIRILLLPQRFV